MVKKYEVIIHMKVDEHNRVSKLTFNNVVSHVINTFGILCITCNSGCTAQIPLHNIMFYEIIELIGGDEDEHN